MSVGIAQQNLAIFERGEYVAPSGKTISLRGVLDAAVSGTVLYRPGDFDSLEVNGQANAPRIETTPETTGMAARRLAQQEGVERVCALNFASAKNPGGGFLRGAKAQEEDLARCSALYACLLPVREYYAVNRASGSMLYTDHIIYSPDVPFFRDEQLRLLEAPFLTSLITAPAPNAGEAERQDRNEGAAVKAVLESRARKVLEVAAAEGHRCLVLGAWGCGVFGNDPREVANAFSLALCSERLRGAFERVVFAIWERNPARPTWRIFDECFRSTS